MSSSRSLRYVDLISKCEDVVLRCQLQYKGAVKANSLPMLTYLLLLTSCRIPISSLLHNHVCLLFLHSQSLQIRRT
jgi:hypothetical protein